MLGSLWFNSFSSGGGASAAYELISTTVLGSDTASVTFSSLNTGVYKHLQLRITGRSTVAGNTDNVAFRFNADSGSNYVTHYLLGDGTSASSGAFTSQPYMYLPSNFPAASAQTNSFGGAVVDLLDAFSTTKNKTMRALNGYHGTPDNLYGRISLTSGAWLSTSAITSIAITNSANFKTGSRFSIYGLR